MSGTLKLTDASPVQTFAEVLTVGEVEHFLGLSSVTDPERTTLLESFIAGAREQAEILQNRDLIVKQWDLTRDYFPVYEIELRQPLVSVDLFERKDSDGLTTQLAANTDYIVDIAKGIVLPPYGCSWPSFMPWPSSAVLVRFTSGFSAESVFWQDAGARIKTGMKHLISAWFNNRLPFEMGSSAAQEYPFTVTALLTAGAIKRQR